MHFGLVAKTPICFMFVRLFICTKVAFTGQISVKFYVRENPNFVKTVQKIWHFTWIPKYVSLLPSSLIAIISLFFKRGVKLLGTFAKLRKPTISFVMSVRPSVRMDQLSFHWANFRGIWYLSIFIKSVKKIQVSLKSNQKNAYFIGRPI
jgi:hypothetical protein